MIEGYCVDVYVGLIKIKEDERKGNYRIKFIVKIKWLKIYCKGLLSKFLVFFGVVIMIVMLWLLLCGIKWFYVMILIEVV